MWCLIVVVLYAASPALTAVYRDQQRFCSFDEFACGDGACVSLDRRCDGAQHCADGSDEQSCATGSNNLDFRDVLLSRHKRQSGCRKNQHRCRDGTCISFDGKCDGVVDCPDRSDESHALCRGMRCPSNLFRCTYGACVDGTAPCNGVTECADNSDELLPRCRNETLEVRGQFTCKSGEKISAADHCDGVENCKDGSDERIESCAGKRCASYLFQCAYGACADDGVQCDNKQDCADGSDEADELCGRNTTTTSISPNACVLPPYPSHGHYTVDSKPYAKPGQAYDWVSLAVTCAEGYGVIGSKFPYCSAGTWREPMPTCSRFCKLTKHPSVTYRCEVKGDNILEGARICEDYEPAGTLVRPECNPNYFSTYDSYYMRCIDGSWDTVVICLPDCGRLTPSGTQLIINGTSAKRGELPWHAGIYDKNFRPYMQICGGSLVSKTMVISAAHCFWNENASSPYDTTRYAVALGKLYRPWNDPMDVGVQKSDVSDIWIPPHFGGQAANYQDDIALVILSTPMVYVNYIRPICISYNLNFDKRQLVSGNMGKVAGWGLTAEDGNASPVLKTVELPYVEVGKCIADLPVTFRAFITSDKICAGTLSGTALCHGDSGGGLAFPETEQGSTRYYLRGIVSTAPRNDHACNVNSYTTFTHILKHDNFIREHFNPHS